MLLAEDVRKSYDSIDILKGVRLQIDRGEVVAIVGASGVGKTTLLHVLGTLSHPSAGKVYIDGQDVFAKKHAELARFRNRHIGFVFQFHNLLPEFSALENIMMPALIAGEQQPAAAQRAERLAERLGLMHRLKHKPSTLSGGEQQRVAVARALINNPAMVFADEPGGNLDAKNAAELHRLFFDLRKEFTHTFVVVTHSRELADMADRKLEMENGVLIER